ncbi:hypothetical protein SZ05_04815, partial [Vibrio parahaemolyticus]
PNNQRKGETNGPTTPTPPPPPIGNTHPPYPKKPFSPATEINDAADTQSAAVAMPLAIGFTPPPAT